MIDEQKKGKLAKAEKLNAIIRELNPLINLQGKGGVNVIKSDANIVITLGEGDEGDAEEEETELLEMWVCDLTDPLNPTPVQRKFWVEKVTP